MNDFLNPRQCRETIAELAEILPRLFNKQELATWPSSIDERGKSRRGRWDPVFTGGSVVGLLITDPAAPQPSRTKDIDIVLEITGYGEFASMEQMLRQAGFTQNWLENVPVVAWQWRGVRVDFLPHKPTDMMKTNQWFPCLIVDEMEFTAPDVRGFVVASCRELLGKDRFMECIPQIVPDDTREEVVSNRLRKIAASK